MRRARQSSVVDRDEREEQRRAKQKKSIQIRPLTIGI
jgi:hypothetical protein